MEKYIKTILLIIIAIIIYEKVIKNFLFKPIAGIDTNPVILENPNESLT